MQTNTTYSNLDKPEGIDISSLKAIADDFRAKREDMWEVVIGSETVIDKLREWIKEHNGKKPMMKDNWFGIKVISVPDEIAVLIPDLGLDHIKAGKMADAQAVINWIESLKLGIIKQLDAQWRDIKK